ncbi:MAG: hypothetical protein ACYTG0_35420 [Planctomycetota bacterium]|jgi:hypothetical protein
MAYGERRLIYRSLWTADEIKALTDRELLLLILMLVCTDREGFGKCNPRGLPYEAPLVEKPKTVKEAIWMLTSVSATGIVEVRTNWKGEPADPIRCIWLYRAPGFLKAQSLRVGRGKRSELRSIFDNLRSI